jgi:hypothetical protein
MRVTAMSRQLAIVVLVCGAYVVAIGTTTTSIIAANKIAVIFCILVINASLVNIITRKELRLKLPQMQPLLDCFLDC